MLKQTMPDGVVIVENGQRISELPRKFTNQFTGARASNVHCESTTHTASRRQSIYISHCNAHIYLHIRWGFGCRASLKSLSPLTDHQSWTRPLRLHTPHMYSCTYARGQKEAQHRSMRLYTPLPALFIRKIHNRAPVHSSRFFSRRFFVRCSGSVFFFCFIFIYPLFLPFQRDKRVSVTLFTHNGEPNLNSEQHRISVGQINTHLARYCIFCVRHRAGWLAGLTTLAMARHDVDRKLVSYGGFFLLPFFRSFF